MKAALAVAVILLAACSNTSARVAAVSPTPRASGITATATAPAPASASQSSTPDVTAVGAGLSLGCRLPVTWAVSNSANQQATQAGFVTFPNWPLAKDVTAPAGSVFYDRAFGKWLPVFRSNVSPDGRHYAYSKVAGNAYQNTGSSIYVVDVATGTSRVVYSGSYAYWVIDFETEGVYLTSVVPEGAPRGLWFQDLAGDPPRLISGDIVAPAVGGGAAWGLDFNTADKNPAPGGLEGPRNRLLRYDLRTGVPTPWFYRPGANINMSGVDASGRPVVTAYVGPSDSSGQQAAEVWLIGSSTQATRIFADPSGSSLPNLAAVDRHGVWFDSPYSANGPSSLWLYTQGSMQIVATVNRADVAIAGGCIP